MCERVSIKSITACFGRCMLIFVCNGCLDTFIEELRY